MTEETTGQRIQRLRKARGLTQSKLARAIDVEPDTVSRWEVGKFEPSGDSLPRLAEVLGVTMDELVGRAHVELELEVLSVVEEVIAELGSRLSAAARATLRTTNWHPSGLSAGTVRSYALDLMLVESGKAKASTPVKIQRRPGRRSIDDKD